MAAADYRIMTETTGQQLAKDTTLGNTNTALALLAKDATLNDIKTALGLLAKDGSLNDIRTALGLLANNTTLQATNTALGLLAKDATLDEVAKDATLDEVAKDATLLDTNVALGLLAQDASLVTFANALVEVLASVKSVNGKYGVVVLDSGDILISKSIQNSKTVQEVLQEATDAIARTPLTFATSAIAGTEDDYLLTVTTGTP